MISEGCIVVAELPQADGKSKLRPILLLRVLPGFSDYLVCGVSTQLHQAVAGFDLVLTQDGEGFHETGLRASSVVRLNFLATLPQSRMVRLLGNVSADQLSVLQRNLANHILSSD